MNLSDRVARHGADGHPREMLPPITAISRAAHDYQTRVARFERDRDRSRRSAARLSRARLVIVLVAAGLLLASGNAASPTLVVALRVTALALGLTFLVLAHWHRAVKRLVRRSELMLRINEEGLHRLARRWDALPASADVAIDDPPYARDLD